ncbi:MAG: DMT family transporter [Candidatus Delongbacteria bacterium]|nr:DMT family transporter [Candidatus Delongbacteria bacterium]MBN2835720.1 DMT family transporter [Candidatus Delongbacteria bacterium]
MLILFLISFLWGSSFIFGKLLLDNFSPEMIVTARFFIALVLFTAFYSKKIKLSKTLFRRGSIIGLINGLTLIVQFLGLKYTTPSNSAFLSATYVLYVPLLEYFFWKRKIKRSIISSVLISVLGVYFLSFTDLASFSMNRGDLITLICGFLFAFQIFFIGHYTRKENVYGLVFMQFSMSFFASFIVLIGKFIFTNETLPEVSLIFDSEIIFNIMWLGIMCTLLPFALQFIAQKKVDPTVAGIVYLTEPVFAMILSFFIIGETFSTQKIIGILLILFGVVLANNLKLRGIRSGIRDLLKKLD